MIPVQPVLIFQLFSVVGEVVFRAVDGGVKPHAEGVVVVALEQLGQAIFGGKRSAEFTNGLSKQTT